MVLAQRSVDVGKFFATLLVFDAGQVFFNFVFPRLAPVFAGRGGGRSIRCRGQRVREAAGAEAASLAAGAEAAGAEAAEAAEAAVGAELSPQAVKAKAAIKAANTDVFFMVGSLYKVEGKGLL